MNGTILKWNDDKGFGFIQMESSSTEIFFHIKSIRNRHSRPQIGMKVTFEVGKDNRGRKQAQNVTILTNKKSHPATGPFLFAAAFLGAIGYLVAVERAPLSLFALYVVTSILSFLLYMQDKSAALNGARRTPETTLHNLAIIGGWPGAMVAQQLFRHKSKKTEFRVVFWSTVFANLCALTYLLSPYGAWLAAKMAKALG